MKALCEKLAEQYAEDKSKAYYIDKNGDRKWYITERGRYSKVDFLAGYQAAKDEYKVAIDTYNDVAKQMMEEAVRIMSPKDQLQPQPFHKGADVYIIDANNPFPKPMPLSLAEQDQLADAGKVITYDYVETASKDAEELIAKFELQGDREMLVKALVAAYCRGVDAVDGYLRNSLSAYRNSIKRSQWISVKERLPEEGQEVLVSDNNVVSIKSISFFTHKWHPYENGFNCEPSHWMPLPEAPKGE